MIRIMLTEKDKEYGKALARAISGLHNEFEIKILSLNADKTSELKLASELYDLFLLGGYSYNELRRLLRNNSDLSKAVILTEDYTEEITKQSELHTDNYWFIYKYKNVHEILSDLNYIFGITSGKKSTMRESMHTNIIGFYSISGGVGKSVISIGTSRELSRYHDKKVLHLSFEEIPATELYVKCNRNNRTIGDYLYYLLGRQNENLCSHLDGFTISDEYGVEFFLPSKGKNDLNCLSKEELIYIIKFLSDRCHYDYIVFDLNPDLSEETILLMEQCCKIILVRNNSLVSIFRSEKLLNHLERTFVQMTDRFICVTNKVENIENEQSNSYQWTAQTPLKHFYIEKDENSFSALNNRLEISINHTFGIGIKQITDEILHAD